MSKNNYKFWILFSLTVVLFIITIILQYSGASTGFLFAAIMLLEIYFSEKDINGYHPLKSYYKNKKKIEKYKKLCISLCIIFYLLGILGIILGVLNIWE